MVGSTALDTIESPAGSVKDVLGGTAVYASIAASHFSSPGIIAVVGEDFPEEGRRTLSEHGVDLHGLQTAAGRTFRWGGRYAENFNDRVTLFTELNVFQDFAPRLPENYRQSDMLFLGNIHPALQQLVLEQMATKAFVALDTMNLWIDTALEELIGILPRVDLLLVNDEESRMLTGERHPGHAARKLQALGPRTIIIKEGSHGAWLFHRGKVFKVPALLLDDVKDPTGAGDSFAGGLLGYLDREGRRDFPTLRRALVYGSIMASFCVEGFSIDVLQQVTPEDIQVRFDEFVNLTRFAED